MTKENEGSNFSIAKFFRILILCFSIIVILEPSSFAEIVKPKRTLAIENALDTAEYNMKCKNLSENIYKAGHRSSIKDFFKSLFAKEISEKQSSNLPFKTELGLSIGYRTDDLNWNIASDPSGTLTPNILSELTWSDVKSRQIKTEGSLIFDNDFILEGYFAYGDVYAGDNQDSDYLGDNRTLEFSRSNNNSSEGDMYDASGAMGYKLSIDEVKKYVSVDDFSVTFLGGYSYHQQYFVMTDGYQTVPKYGSFKGLHSFYEAEWKGPWLGFKLSGAYKSLSSFFRFEYHVADYYGHADWNLRTDLDHPKSYEHVADGRGLVFNLGCKYDLTQEWSLGLNIDWQNWETGNGIDRVFAATGETLETRLNEVNWDSYALRLGATYSF